MDWESSIEDPGTTFSDLDSLYGQKAAEYYVTLDPAQRYRYLSDIFRRRPPLSSL